MADKKNSMDRKKAGIVETREKTSAAVKKLHAYINLSKDGKTVKGKEDKEAYFDAL